jgi:thioredoxin 1
MAIEITDANYEEIVGNSDKPVVLDFWAAWCGPCRMIGPLIEEMHTEYEGRAIIGKVDVDNNQTIAAKFGVRNIPTVAFIKNGEVVDKSVGAVPKAQLVEKLDAIL